MVKDITMPGAIVTVSYIVFKPIMPVIADWIRGSINHQKSSTNKNGEVVTLATIDDRVELLASNHMHEIKDGLDRIERAITLQSQSLGSIANDISFIKGRMNGKNH